jgi:hypothetical protein
MFYDFYHVLVIKEGTPESKVEADSTSSGVEARSGNSAEAETVVAEAEQPYEHLFQKILPTVLSPPVEKRTIPSPHLLLDMCLSKAAELHNSRARSDELYMLRGQVELLHGQLLFERHRREAHALRNRRLAGKCRKMQNMEEQNSKMVNFVYIQTSII